MAHAHAGGIVDGIGDGARGRRRLVSLKPLYP
jgi:hypothetical protein